MRRSRETQGKVLVLSSSLILLTPGLLYQTPAITQVPTQTKRYRPNSNRMSCKMVTMMMDNLLAVSSSSLANHSFVPSLSRRSESIAVAVVSMGAFDWWTHQIWWHNLSSPYHSSNLGNHTVCALLTSQQQALFRWETHCVHSWRVKRDCTDNRIMRRGWIIFIG